ncbi:hypothetical protein IVB41_27285 [Bradyrhizobium sp. 44]|uniref:hypothetical protein n=1 Tax=Bradyrhizobium sp. 44 TaxID=2782675 RepID=UPI001FF7A54F|nr:hypothetical protein [Bradyrhizobium sp. 44]MCK1287612.1 hypothetical protein [Bradyrhizobium sp. 44]
MYSSNASTARPYEWFVSAAIVGTAITLIVRTIWLMDRGFDFTDESFYLAWAQQPRAFDIAYGLFGYGLHPLFDMLNGSIAGLRRAAALILVFLGIIASLIAVGSAKMSLWGPTSLQLIAVSAALPFAYYVFWLVTPSYNWFALASGLVMIGATLDVYHPRHSWRSATTAALASVLLIFTRPQNAIAYFGIYLLAVGIVVPTLRGKWLQMLRTAGLAAAVILAVAAVAPLRTIAKQLQAYYTIFGTGNPTDAGLVGRQFDFFRHEGVWIAFSFVLFVGSMVTLRDKRASGKLRNGLVTTGAIIAATATVVQFRAGGFVYDIGPAAGVFAFVCLSLACLRKDADFGLIALLGLSALVPFAATFGTSNRIFSQLAFFTGLWGFVGLVALSSASGAKTFGATVAASICLVMTFLAVQVGLSVPYRLASPIDKQLNPTTLGWGAELKLDARTRDFIATLHNSAKQEGFCQGNAAIDLSGSLPGAVFAIGGRMPVFPWIFAGYSFSDPFAREVFKRIDGSLLAQSWLITSETPGSFSMSELQSFGIDFSAYRLVADVRHPLDGTSVKLFAPRAIQNRC